MNLSPFKLLLSLKHAFGRVAGGAIVILRKAVIVPEASSHMSEIGLVSLVK